MNFDNVKEWGGAASAVLIAVSAAHVLAAAAYLYFYCVGFGANLSVFYSAPDIFSISITKLANVYLRSLIWPAAVMLLLRVLGVKNNHEWIESAASPESKVRRKRQIDKATTASLWMMYVAVVVTALIAGWNWYHGREASAYAVISAVLFAALYFFARRGGLPLTYLVGIFFVGGVVGGAIDNGQADRHLKYSTYRALPFCGEYKVLGRASGNYLAVGKKSEKVLIKDDCKVAFVFPAPNIR
ncbi:hypothetical protein D3C73_316150 [compost metagenome]